jgi:lipoyl(octanoyl) transferase
MNIEIKISKKPIDYQVAIDFLEKRLADVIKNNANELVWILEHNNVYTCGTSGKEHELLQPNKLPTIRTNRGGKWTYHGKGQKVIYFVLNLNKRGKEIKKLVRNIEHWIIEILKEYEIHSYADPTNIGIWVKNNNSEYKIAAIGIKVKKWIAYHGFSINLNVNKDYYSGIIPCGITEKGIINFSDIKKLPSEENLNNTITKQFKRIFTN